MPTVSTQRQAHRPNQRHRLRLLVSLAVLVTSAIVVPLLAAPSPAAAGTVRPIDVSWQYTCAVVSDGTVECWGLDEYGKLGTLPSTNEPNSTPTTVPGVANARSVALGETHACALLADATVTCWGSDDYAQLGDGVADNDAFSATPVPGLTDVEQIEAGGYHNCALLADGTVACWGENSDGEAGVDPGTADPVTTPTAVGGLTDIVLLSASNDHTCAIDDDGVLHCWGAGDEGALGNGTDDASFVPLVVPVSGPVVDVAPGGQHVCAVLATGTVECWGDGSDGQLGNGAADQSYVPVEVSGITNATHLASGESSACARLTDGTVECWGDGSNGQLGNGVDTTDSDSQTTPVDVIGVTDAQLIVGFNDHYCITTTSGDAQCWGEAANGQLAVDAPDSVNRATLAAAITAQEVSVGRDFTCLRGAAGQVGCLGHNDVYQLGNGTTDQTASPVPVSGLSTATQLDAGNEHACVTLGDQTARCWGQGSSGRLGNDSPADAPTPTAVLDDAGAAELADVEQVTAGESHSCAVTTTGTVWCWGRGWDGQLGHGSSPISQDLPVEASGISDGTAVTAGASHSCAVVTAGAVQCWGENGQRQLGDLSLSDSETPVAVDSVTGVTQLSAGSFHTCGRTSSGTVWCWGGDGSGQLGDGPAIATTPVTMTGITTATMVAAGDGITCVLLADETVKCVGENDHGGLGDGTTTSRSEAVTVVDENGVALSGVRSIAVDEHACAARTAAAGGGVYCWGRNDEGQLGFYPWRSTPVTVSLSQTIGATTTTTTPTTTTTTTTTTVPTEPPVSSPLFVPVAPARIVESRTSPGSATADGEQQGIGRLDSGGAVTVDVAGRVGVPDDAVAAVLNITAIRPGGVGYFTAHPCLAPPPTTSSLNFSAGVSLGNEVIVELDDDGNACLFTSADTDVAVDIVAYLPAGAAYSPVGPARLADTRPAPAGVTVDGEFAGDGALDGGDTYEVDVVSRAGVPADATAAVVNITAIRATGVGYFTVHPCLPDAPNAASLNYTAGSNRGNEIIAPLSADGSVCVFSSTPTDLAIDVVGYVSGTAYSPVSPARLLETRDGPDLTTADGEFEGVGKRAAGQTLELDIAGRAGIPADASTVTINVTAIAAEGVGYATVHPCLPAAPNAASLNFVPGVNGGNEIIAEVDANGQICIFTSAAVHLTVDVAGSTT